ncbi:hypothetical protein L3X07_08760 [Levilactobacillus brevis]|nr:hypothetical protein [Levilactobacillus brevis]
MTMTLKQAVEQALVADRDRLAAYVKLETVSAQHRGISETVDFLEQAFRAVEARSRFGGMSLVVIRSFLPRYRRDPRVMRIRHSCFTTITMYSRQNHWTSGKQRRLI